MTDQPGFWWYLVGLHPVCLFLPTEYSVLEYGVMWVWLCVCEEHNTTLYHHIPVCGVETGALVTRRPRQKHGGLKLSPSGSPPRACLFTIGVVKASTAAEHWGGSGTHHKTPGSRIYHSTSTTS